MVTNEEDFTFLNVGPYKNNRYKIFKDGKVFSDYRKEFLKPHQTRGGGPEVLQLSTSRGPKSFNLAKLVYYSFKPEFENYHYDSKYYAVVFKSGESLTYDNLMRVQKPSHKSLKEKDEFSLYEIKGNVYYMKNPYQSTDSEGNILIGFRDVIQKVDYGYVILEPKSFLLKDITCKKEIPLGHVFKLLTDG